MDTQTLDVLPSPFFSPTDAFLDLFARQYAHHVVVDAGCGYGHLVHELNRRGCPAYGVDLSHAKIDAGRRAFPDLHSRLMDGDVIGHPFTKLKAEGKLLGSVLVFARPCHSEWIGKAIRAAPNAIAIYISKPGNETNDLDGLCYKRIFTDIAIGADGEQAWLVGIPDPDTRAKDLALWSLVSFSGGAAWQRNGTRTPSGEAADVWYHGWGRSYCRRSASDVVLETAMIAETDSRYNDDWLDHTKTSTWRALDAQVNDTKLKHGWIAPDGRWLRCGYWGHDQVAYDYLRMTREQIQQAGYVKVDHAADERSVLCGSGHEYLIQCWDASGDGMGGRLTWQQAKTLTENGIEIPEWADVEAPPARQESA